MQAKLDSVTHLNSGLIYRAEQAERERDALAAELQRLKEGKS